MKKVFALLFAACFSFLSFAQSEVLRTPGLYAQFNTDQGSLVFRLYEKEAPLAVISFIGLTEGTIGARDDGTPYYSGLTFYHEIENYALFSGDPENTGRSETGIQFPQQQNGEISLGEKGILAFKGVQGISKAGSFFITLKGDSFLDKVYTPFGKIVEGNDILNKIHEGTVIQSIMIIREGAEAESFSADLEALASQKEAAQEAQLNIIKKQNPALSDQLAQQPDFSQTESGMYYHILYEGFGDKPKMGNTISVHYTGSLLDGTVFDSSVQRGQAFSMTLGKDMVIPGWLETLMDMQPGENRTVFIPPSLGYGNQGAGGIIPPNAWLNFEIQLLSID